MTLSTDSIDAPVVHRLANRKQGIIGKWVSTRECCLLLPMIIWATGRLAVVVTFMLYVIDRKWINDKGGRITPPSASDGQSFSVNTTITTTENSQPEDVFYYCSRNSASMQDDSLRIIRYFIYVFAVMSYLRDGCAVFQQCRNARRHNLRMGHWERTIIFKCLSGAPDGIVLQWQAYFIGNYLTPALMVVVVVLLPMSTDRSSNLQVVTDALNLAAVFGVILYVMFFLQLAPFFGPFVITIMRLLLDLMRFAVLLFLTVVAFSIPFISVMNAQTQQGCIPDFNGMGRTMYTMFTMSVNMVTFAEFKVVNPGFVYTLHLLGTLFLGILFYNFLIGILSNSVAEMAANMEVIVMLQQQFSARVMETTYWPLVKHYYRWIQPRHFTCENGRIYVIRRVHPSVSSKNLMEEINSPFK